MSIKYKHKTIYYILLLLLGVLYSNSGYSQELNQDSIQYSENSSIQSAIDYFAKDSIVSNPIEKTTELYNEAFIKYEDFELRAGYIRFNMSTDMVYAHGLLDSTGALIQEPELIQAGKTYNSDTILFNMKSKKGKIQKIAIEEGEGFLYGHDIKRMPDNSLNIKNSIYTTCNHPEPHFYIKLNKLKLTKDKKVITGPANLVIAGVKTPLVLPFGFFPLTSKNPVGIIIPSYNFSNTRGYSLNGLGFYMGFSDYWDNKITADLYTGGGYNVNNLFRYNSRYKHSGSIDLGYSSTRNLVNPSGDSYNYRIFWEHRQSPKANPFSSFTANVDMSSSGYNQNNNVNLNRQIQASFNSSINYNRSVLNDNATLNITARHNLTNSGDKPVTLTLPDLQFNSNTAIFPFRTKRNLEKKSILSLIKVTPTFKTKTVVNTFDSLMFTSNMFDEINSAAEYNLPFAINLYSSKIFSIRPNFGYKGTIYTKKYDYTWNNTTEELETEKTDGFYHLYDYNASLTFSLNPTIYGLFNFNNSKIKAIRHVIDPSVSYTYNFNILDQNRYYQYVQINSDGDYGFRSQYNQGRSKIFSVPGSPTISDKHRWGTINFGLNNNIEIKVKDKSNNVSDSLMVNGGTDPNGVDAKFKKIKIFRRFDFSSSYNLDADSLKMTNISLVANSDLGNNFTVNNTLYFNPYIEQNGVTINKYFWEDGKLIPKLISIKTDISFSITGKSKTGKTTQDKINNVNESLLTDSELRDFNEVKYNAANYIDFDIPYSLKLMYSLFYEPSTTGKNTLNQSVTFNGDLSLTDNWKIVYRSGFDFSNKKISQTELSIKRDLHCWQMSLVWVPFGSYRSYGFAISVKASILQDLKLNKREAAYDHFRP